MAETPIPHIPDYELLRIIGKGSYGEVWLAKAVTGTFRAIKIVHRESFDHDRPYEREFSGLKKFEPVSRTHETQVGILHVGRNDEAGFFYYVMELADDLVTGQVINPETYKPWSLRSDLYRVGPLNIHECMDIGLHLAGALGHIHKNGLVHRDVKSSNIIFINRVPKLADIGLVTSTEATRSFVGTEGYIPPEGPGTPQADIYSLGKVLYEISTGRNRLDFPELPTELKDSPDREAMIQFNEVVLKACEEDPSLRYQTAEELRTDLELLKSGRPLRAIASQSSVNKLLLWFFGGSKSLSNIKVGQYPQYGSKKGIWVLSMLLVIALLIISASWMKNGSRSQSGTLKGPGRNYGPPLTDVPGTPSEKELLTGGLIAHWKGDSTNDSAGNHPATIHGNVSFAKGVTGQAFSFNTDGGCVEVADNPDLRFGGKSHVTISAWVFRSSENIPFHIFGKRIKCSRDIGSCDYQLGIDYSIPQTPINKWVFWTLVNDGGWVSIYTNGSFAKHLEDFGPTNSAPFRIGASGDCAGGFLGLIGDVRIYNRTFSAEEIQKLFKLTGGSIKSEPTEGDPAPHSVTLLNSTPPSGLVAWWKGDGNALDFTGRHNGTLMNNATFSMGLGGKAFLLNLSDTNNDFISVPNSSAWAFNTNDFSIELYAKFRDTSGNQAFAACDDGGGSLNKWIFWKNNDHLDFHVVTATGLWWHLSPKTKFTPIRDQWYHLAVTRDSFIIHFYINGVEVWSEPWAGSVPKAVVPLTIGKAESGFYFLGMLQDVRIYNRALSGSEIAEAATVVTSSEKIHIAPTQSSIRGGSND